MYLASKKENKQNTWFPETLVRKEHNHFQRHHGNELDPDSNCLVCRSELFCHIDHDVLRQFESKEKEINGKHG